MNMADTKSPPTFTSGPGQDLDEVAQHFNPVELATILGQDVVSLIGRLVAPEEKIALLRQVAAGVLRDRTELLLARRDIRGIIYDAMSDEKLAEFADRLGVPNTRQIRTLDPTQDDRICETFLGFFGIDTRGPVFFSVEPERQSVRPEFGLFPHQRHAADRVCDAIRGGHGRVVLHMPTGAGKTRTAMHIVSRVMTKHEPAVIVWLAASAELLDQAADAFQGAWSRLGNRPIDIVRFWGDYAPDISAISDGLIIAGLQKMHAWKMRDPIGVLRIARSVKLVVVDEAHQAIAPTYREVIETLAETGVYNALIGLTATPGRTWLNISADERLSEFFNGRKVMLEVEGWDNPVSFLIEQGYLAKATFRRLEVDAAPELRTRLKKASTDNDYEPKLLEAIAGQEHRNVMVVNEIRRLIGEEGHRRLILFAASVRHAEILASVLAAIGIDARVITASTGMTARTRIIKAFRRTRPNPMVLCNFGVLTTGFDAPNTSAAVIARPTKSLVLFSQMVGRATRGPRAGGNEICTVSTVVDIHLPGFGDIAEAFTNWEDVWDAHP